MVIPVVVTVLAVRRASWDGHVGTTSCTHATQVVGFTKEVTLEEPSVDPWVSVTRSGRDLHDVTASTATPVRWAEVRADLGLSNIPSAVQGT